MSASAFDIRPRQGGAVIHTVLLKLSPTCNVAELSSLTRALEAMQGSIPGVLSVSAGSIFVPGSSDDRTAGYNYALSVELASPDSLDAYAVHPVHVAVKKDHIGPLLDTGATGAKVLAVDWDRGGVEETTYGWAALIAAAASGAAAALLLLRRRR